VGIKLQRVVGYSLVAKGADLTDAELGFAQLEYAFFEYATLARADLTKACLSGASLAGADLTGANLAQIELKSGSILNLDNTVLDHANLGELCTRPGMDCPLSDAAPLPAVRNARSIFCHRESGDHRN
jgi:uncharacterized protein YjbI with pentapeptide repeats